MQRADEVPHRRTQDTLHRSRLWCNDMDLDLALAKGRRSFEADEAGSHDPTAIKVGEMMSHQPAVAAESDAIDAALKTMQRMGVRRVPVVNGQGELVGVLSLDDLLGFVAGEVDGLARLVRNGRQIEGVLRS